MNDQWWFKVLGQEMGPVSFASLIDTAHSGTLAPSDTIRQGENGLWRRADSIRVLFDKDGASAAHEPVWTVEMAGQILGPLAIAEVADLIRQRKLVESDRIRRFESRNWRSVGVVLQNQLPSIAPGRPHAGPGSQRFTSDDSSFSSMIDADDKSAMFASIAGIEGLEGLIQELLAQPFEANARPTLAELGLDSAAHTAIPVIEVQTDETQTRQTAETTTCNSISTKRSCWERLNSNRSGASPQIASLREHAQLAPDISAASLTNLTPVARVHDSNRSDGTDDSDPQAAKTQKRVPWLEALLLLGGMSLHFQFFPSTWSTVLTHMDVRVWTRRTWVVAEVLVIVILVGLAIRQRRR